MRFSTTGNGMGGLRSRSAGGAPNSPMQYRAPTSQPSYGGGPNPYLSGGQASGQQTPPSPYLGGGFSQFGNSERQQSQGGASPFLGGRSRQRGGGDYSQYGPQAGGNRGGIGSTQRSANQMPDYSQRDAFIQRLNDTMAGYQANQGVYQGQGAPPPSWGQPPQFNFPQLWQDAGQMVSNGWRNPLLGLLG